MSVYKRFGPSDILQYNLNTSPKAEFASGATGWRGSTGDGGKISLYGGIRSKETVSSGPLTIQPVYELDTHTADGKLKILASYPFTGSLSYVQVRDATLDLNDEVHDSLWGEEHFSPIMNLYDFYHKSDSDFMTGSYDYYMLYSEPGSKNKVTMSSSLLDQMSDGYTVEAMIKPLSISGSAESYTIASRTNLWSFYIKGVDGRLAFSASDGSGLVLTSSISATIDRWQHVAYSVLNGTGSFSINVNDAGQHPGVTGSIDQSGSIEPLNVMFNEKSLNDSFHGFMFDTKVWKSGRTNIQLSESFDRTLFNSSSVDLLAYFRFNDGPRKTAHGFTRGSGSYNFGAGAHGLLQNFDSRTAPIWHPNDNRSFIVPKSIITNTIDELRVVHVPSLFYGRQMMTGSIKLVCNAFMSSSLQRVLVDDGRGGLYLSGSATSASLDTREEYRGVQWNKVGNVFYSEGLIVIKDPALLDFGFNNPDSQFQNDLLQISFAGQQTIPSKVFMCRINGADSNASHNPSYSTRDDITGKLLINLEKPVTYITAVGLYDKNRKLVAVAKLASPIRNREKDRLNIKLKLDF